MRPVLGIGSCVTATSMETTSAAGQRSMFGCEFHEYPSKGMVKFVGVRDKGFKALLEIEAESGVTRSEIDDAFRRLLQAINATNVTEIEPYDC